MYSFIKPIIEKPVVLWSLSLALLCNIYQWILIAIYYGSLPPEIPIFRSLAIGESMLANKEWFYYIAIIGFLIWLFNTLVIRFSDNLYNVYQASIAGFTLIESLLLAIVSSHIIWLTF